jgi:hypothetical protein
LSAYGELWAADADAIILDIPQTIGRDAILGAQQAFWESSPTTRMSLAGLSFGDADYLRVLEQVGESESKGRVPLPSQRPGAHPLLQHGQRRDDYLVNLTSGFKPNHFSIT